MRALFNAPKFISSHDKNRPAILDTLNLLTKPLMLCLLLVISATAFSEEEAQVPNNEQSDTEATSEADDASTDEEAQATITLTTQDWKDIQRPKANGDQQREQLLKSAADPRQVIELDTPSETFFGLYLERNTAQPIGAALILHDTGLNADEPSFVSPLRNNLTDYGWSTLTISIPDPDTTPLPNRKWPSYPADFTLTPPEEGEDTTETPDEKETEESSENTNPETSDLTESTTEKESNTTEPEVPASDTQENNSQENGTQENKNATADEAAPASSEDSPSEPEITQQERTMQRIDAAIQHLQAQGLLNIAIIGHGISASWAVSYLDSTRSPEMFTLVMLDARLPDAETDMDYLNTKIQNFDTMPVLDLVTSQTQTPLTSAKERKSTANRHQVNNYLQLKVSPTIGSNTPHNRLVKRVRGWLAQNAPGEERKTR